jgi:hypothetical protein
MCKAKTGSVLLLVDVAILENSIDKELLLALEKTINLVLPNAGVGLTNLLFGMRVPFVWPATNWLQSARLPKGREGKFVFNQVLRIFNAGWAKGVRSNLAFGGRAFRSIDKINLKAYPLAIAIIRADGRIPFGWFHRPIHSPSDIRNCDLGGLIEFYRSPSGTPYANGDKSVEDDEGSDNQLSPKFRTITPILLSLAGYLIVAVGWWKIRFGAPYSWRREVFWGLSVICGCGVSAIGGVILVVRFI